MLLQQLRAVLCRREQSEPAKYVLCDFLHLAIIVHLVSILSCGSINLAEHLQLRRALSPMRVAPQRHRVGFVQVATSTVSFRAQASASAPAARHHHRHRVGCTPRSVWLPASSADAQQTQPSLSIALISVLIFCRAIGSTSLTAPFGQAAVPTFQTATCARAALALHSRARYDSHGTHSAWHGVSSFTLFDKTQHDGQVKRGINEPDWQDWTSSACCNRVGRHVSAGV